MRFRSYFTSSPSPRSQLQRVALQTAGLLLTSGLSWLALGSTSASAQVAETIVLNTDRITRIGDLRPIGRLPHWISYDDCVANEVITFPLTPSTTGYTLEVWVGTSDCVTLRSSTNDRQQCWLVASDSSPDVQRYSIDVPVRNVVAKRTNLSDQPPVDLPEDVCRESTETNGQNLTYYFMLVGGGNPQASAIWGGGTGASTGGQANTGFDVVGPAPPDSIQIGLGEGDLSIEIDDPGENSDRSRFQAYCVSQTEVEAYERLSSSQSESTSSSRGPDAGTNTSDADLSDAGQDASTDPVSIGAGVIADAGAVTTCNQSLLVPNQRPPATSLIECGEAGTSARTMRTSSLVNGRTYAVAVAGEDLLGNVGPVSNVECAAPVPLEDFFESYRRQGGPGGGGYCSFQPTFPSKSTPLWSLGAALLALGLLRRRSGKRSQKTCA